MSFQFAMSLVVLCTSVVQDGVNTTRSSSVDLELPSDEEGFVFVIFGDRTGGPAEGIAVLQEAVRDTNLLDPDLVMTVGDLVDGYNAKDAWMRQMAQYKAVMDGLECPWFPVAGNHDIYWRGAGRPAEEHEANYEEHFGPLWYDFSHRNAHFIVLYTDEPDPATGERNFSKASCQVMSDEQIEFLVESLERGSAADHVFVFLHHPRWLKGAYGDDWERVHAVLAGAGNVSACFAGHIHQMRHDGTRDGIEYISLATVGGHQNSFAPEAGWDHQFHVVTVRPESVAMAAVPVDELLDVRDITGQVSSDARTLAGTRPLFPAPLEVGADGEVEEKITTSLTNPTNRPIVVSIQPKSMDPRWSFSPPHAHQRIGPGETAIFSFDTTRSPLALDHFFRPPFLTLDIEYLTRTRAYTIPTKEVVVPVRVQLRAPEVPDKDMSLSLNGHDQALMVPSAEIPLPQGPMTLEARIKATDYAGRRGLIAKTEQSEYGFFGSNGVPEFAIFLDGAYVYARGTDFLLEPGREYHLAGVYDGSEVRLYIDGEAVAKVPASGNRRTNQLPLVIGGDVDGRGMPTSVIGGLIDEVRLSSSARYSGDRFDVQRRLEPDQDTLLLLHFDGAYGQYHHDDSGRDAHAISMNDPVLE